MTMGFISDAVGAASSLLGNSSPTDFYDVGPAKAFTIKQLTPGANGKRSVVLKARGLPYRPAEFETTQRAEFTWIPGFAEATVTVLGPAEEPSTFHGYWKDKFVAPDNVVSDTAAPGAAGTVAGLVGGPLGGALNALAGGGPKAKTVEAPIQIGGDDANNVQEVCDYIDAICREGQLVEVVWGSKVRHGLLRSFRQTWHNSHDVEWQMKFEWSSRGEGTPAVKLAEPEGPKPATLLSTMTDLVKAAQDPKFSLVPEVLTDINAGIASIQTSVNGVQNLANAMVEAVLSPLNTIQQAIATVSGTIGFCKDLAERLENIVPGEMNAGVALPAGIDLGAGGSTGFVGGAAAGGVAVSGTETAVTPSGGLGAGAGAGGTTTTPPTPEETKAASQAAVAALNFGEPAALGDRSFSETMQAKLYVKTLVKLTRKLRFESIQFRAILVDQIRHQLLAVYTARDGDELRHVSRLYYGTMTHWQDLMIFNGLTSSVLTRGQLVLIPKVPEGQGGAG